MQLTSRSFADNTRIPGTNAFCIPADSGHACFGANRNPHLAWSSLPRTDFLHWVLVDLTPAGEIAEGEFSDCVTPAGKPGPEGPRGTRQGINDYTAWFAGDDQMKGDYYGYDGPCPPWNDEIRHRYVFTLYALDIARLPVDGRFTAADARRAMAGHVLDEARLTGVYTLNPEIAG